MRKRLGIGQRRGRDPGDGWMLFVEVDSYAIAYSSCTLEWTVELGNSMGLILDARSSPFPVSERSRNIDCCPAHSLWD